MNCSKCLLIHNTDYNFNNLFDEEIKFDLEASYNSNIDEFITNKIDELSKKDFEVIVIKESLSSNYLDFFGLLFATHIRLSINLGKKRFFPIVIISDINIDLINRLSTFSNILYTPNIHYIFHDDYSNLEKVRSGIEFAKVNPIKLNEDNFEELFLNKINITIPKENLSKHSISNEWAIYKWSKLLSINGEDLTFLNEHVKSSLYFKYLDNLHNLEINNLNKIDYKFNFVGPCNILYIDDESEKGWGTIMSGIFSPINSEYLGKDFKDKTSKEIIDISIKKIFNGETKPQIVILDLRLCDDDFKENRSVEELTGTMILNEIKNINPGIQCIIFSATSKSVILNHLFNIGILGFIKKDSPDESYLSTEQNIINFNQLINEGIRKKFLIEVFNTIKNIESKFEYIDEEDLDSVKIELLKNNLYMAFEILNGNNDNHLNYGMLTIFKCLEIIKDSLTIVKEEGKSINEIFIYIKVNHEVNEYSERGRNVKDKSPAEKIQIYKSSRNRLKIALIEYLGFDEEAKEILQLDEIVDKRNDFIHPENEFEDVTTDEILSWIKLLSAIINKLSSMK